MEVNMPFGATVTSYVADLFPTDPLAPQLVSDFAQALPPSPIRGAAVSDFASVEVRGGPPIHPHDLGQSLSDYLQILLQPDVSVGHDLMF
jgi:hypothetical protein